MYTVEVKIECSKLGKGDCEIIRKALEPDNKVEGLSISISCSDSIIFIEMSGVRVNSVRAAYNDLARALAPLLTLLSKGV